MAHADIERLRTISGVKWTRYGPDVLPAWVADMDFDPAPEIKNAMKALIDAGDLGYNPTVTDPLIPTWLDWNEANHGWRPPQEECYSLTGTLHGLELAMLHHTEPGDGVVIFSPSYYPFRHGIEKNSRRVVDVPLTGPQWRMDPDQFEAALDPGTKAVVLCQPHNPLGRVFSTEELRGFAEVCERHDLLILNDEIWADLVHAPNEHISIGKAAPDVLHRTVTLAAASKTFNIAGMRCAVAHVGSETVRPAFANFPAHQMGAPSTIGSLATITAFTKATTWLDEVRNQLLSNIDTIAKCVTDEMPGVKFNRPEATYLAWLDFSETAIAEDPAKHILKSAGVALDQGIKFGDQAKSCARLNFATSEEILKTILDRIIDSLPN